MNFFELFQSKCPVFVRKNDIIVCKKAIKKKISSYEGISQNGHGKYTLSWSVDEQSYEHVIELMVSSTNDGKYDYVAELDYGLFTRKIYCKKTKLNHKTLTDVFIAVQGCCFKRGGECYRVLRHVIQSPKISSEKNLMKCASFLPKRQITHELFTHYVCYDVETCADKVGVHKTYLAYFAVYDKDFKQLEVKKICIDNQESESMFGTMDEWDEESFDEYSFINAFGEWWRKTFYDDATPKNICLFGFNSARFDNHFVYQYFLNNKYNTLFRERFGKTTRAVFENNMVKVFFCDLVAWLPEKSLKEALTDYECSAKDDLNIVQFNKYFAESNFNYRTFNSCSAEIFKSCFPLVNRMDMLKLTKKYQVIPGHYDLFKAVQDYCLQDVLATFELFSKIQSGYLRIVEVFKEVISLMDNIFYYISPSQIAGVLLNAHLAKHSCRLQILNEDWFNFLNDSFFGGRVDFGLIGEYINEKGICCMDVTSMYPLAMTARFPIIEDSSDVLVQCMFSGTTQIIKKLIEADKCLEQLFVVRCNFYLPEEKWRLCSFGPIPHRLNGKLVFPNWEFKNKIVTSVHIKTAIKCGYRVEVVEDAYNTLFVKSGPILKEFLTKLIDEKAKAKEDNKALGKLYKLFANSCHGKLAQKVEAKYRESNYCNDRWYNFSFEAKDFEKSRIYIATFVTSYANLILMQSFLDVEKHYIAAKVPLEERLGSLLYCDTDSIFFSITDDTDLSVFTQSEQLGCFDFKKGEFNATWNRKANRCNAMMILGKKSYFTMEAVGDKRIMMDLKLKGVHSAEMAQFTHEVVMKSIVRPFIAKTGNGLVFERTSLVQRDQVKPDVTLDDGDDGSKQISFEGLVRKNIEVSIFKGNYEKSFVKQIYQTILKKTLRVNLPPSKKLMKKVSDDLIFYYS